MCEPLCPKCEYLENERVGLLNIKKKFDIANQLNESLKLQQDVANRRERDNNLSARRQV